MQGCVSFLHLTGRPLFSEPPHFFNKTQTLRSFLGFPISNGQCCSRPQKSDPQEAMPTWPRLSLRQTVAAPNHEQPLTWGPGWGAGRPSLPELSDHCEGTGSQQRWETALSASAPVEGRPPPFPSVRVCVPAGGLRNRVVRCSAGKSGCERRPGSRALPDVIISALKWLLTVGAMSC